MGVLKGMQQVNGKTTFVAPHTESDDEKAMYAHYEEAARTYCGLLAVNADDLVVMAHPKIQNAHVSIERWKLQVPALRDYELKYAALSHTSGARNARADALRAAETADASAEAVAVQPGSAIIVP